LRFDFDANNLSTARPISITAAGAVTARLTTNNPNTFVTLSGAITGGSSTGALTKSGSGTVELTGTAGWSSFTRIGDSSVAELPGENVLRVSALPNTNLRLNQGGILEWNGSTFSRTYGTGGTAFYVEDAAGNGAGFAAGQSSGLTVSANINFGTTNTTQWVGPMYFGTALSTATGKLTMSGTLAVTASVTVPQTLHVFNGASAGAASSARINTLNSSLNPGFTFVKAGPGALFVVNGSYGATRATMRVSEGAYEVGPTTLNATGNIEIPSGATNAVVRQESSVAATTCPDFAPAPAANFEIEAAGTGTFTLGVLDISSRTVTLSGSGTGVKSSTAGTGAGRYVKTGTGSWELAYAYADLSAGFTGGVEVQAGLIKASKRYALGGGPVALKAGQLRFTDTTTTIGSIASLSTVGQTSTPRIILGA